VFKKLKKQTGQAIIEAVLLIAVLFGIVSFIAKEFKDDEIVKSLVSGPWLAISSMIANGNWQTKDGEKSHPNYHSRHVTVLGKEAN
jgi:hypothetical protein